jgi:putative methyltransferase (TIGR04325 family)
MIEGYENAELVDTIYRKTIAYLAPGNWPLVENVKTVLDFGGGAGVHYKTACQQSPDIRWAVVETPAMVQRVMSLSTGKLMFFECVEDAADWLGSVDLVHSNGAIQYVPDAIATIRALCSVQPTMLAWYRVPISEETRREVQTSYLSDNGPGKSLAATEKLVRYERNWICEQAFLDAHEGFRVAERTPDPTERGTQHFKFVRE